MDSIHFMRPIKVYEYVIINPTLTIHVRFQRTCLYETRQSTTIGYIVCGIADLCRRTFYTIIKT